MEIDDHAFLARLLESGVLVVGSDIDSAQVSDYWSGAIEVPGPIDADVIAYLARGETEALIGAALWVVRNHFLSGSHPALHMRLVHWLYAQDRLPRSELLGLLALLSYQHLDQECQAIALLAMEMLDEGRPDEGLDLIELMLSAGSCSA
ncbi:hypothetical protein C1924_05865 [Stenotrophomonas sp. ESTM1D_MKCIP4_1]|uniref:hypothetical protein n=1 Tax=Stenotrophomonas sp. ESTM1D_MKCIP4_1 TaxID=2072414 RepID=UPI000D540F44|nr:hypothetical protein [Stenotrophomonas sp. ESTM1D_MKCIP4_1]AWH52732.1 hypothetical protein C1924_05865 [Stenotrophomonas sp. ESTM1D_MKCIP4_1]